MNSAGPLLLILILYYLDCVLSEFDLECCLCKIYGIIFINIGILSIVSTDDDVISWLDSIL